MTVSSYSSHTKYFFHPRQFLLAREIAAWILLRSTENNVNNPFMLIKRIISPTSNNQSFANVIRIMMNRGWIYRERNADQRYYTYWVNWQNLTADEGYANFFFLWDIYRSRISFQEAKEEIKRRKWVLKT